MHMLSCVQALAHGSDTAMMFQWSITLSLVSSFSSTIYLSLHIHPYRHDHVFDVSLCQRDKKILLRG